MHNPCEPTRRFRAIALLLGFVVSIARAEDDPTQHLSGNRFAQRHQLAERGVTFDLTLTIDGTKNLTGGIDTAGDTWRRLFDLGVTFDTKRLFGLEGGIAFFDFQYAQGPNPSDELVGDLQGIDGLDGIPGAPHQNRTQISQLWYQQTAFNGFLRIKAGKVDANTEFDHSTAAQEFLNQSAGSSATLFTLPTYPDPSFGVNVFIKPWSDLQIGFGFYDGAFASGVRTGEMGPSTFAHDGDLFFIGEIDQSWTLGASKLPGRAGIGAWYSTNTFTRLDGGQTSGTGGPYALLDQMLWRANPTDADDARGVSLFVMYGYADPAILPYGHNIGGGLSGGPIPSRDDDVLGIGAQCIHFSDGYHATAEWEASYELFYRVQLTKWFSIKPDLQYVANPSGNGTQDALALTLRVQVDF